MDNFAGLYGSVLNKPVFSHTIGDSQMYTCVLGAERLSGALDEVTLLFDSRFLPLMQGTICVEGKLRGYTRQEEMKRRLHLMILVKKVGAEIPEENNRVELCASLYKDPIYRQTPLGREIADLLLRVRREKGGSDYIPSIVWGGCARFAQRLQKGDPLHVLGRMQSRKYMKQLDDNRVEERTAYELSINKLSRLSIENT